MKNIKLMDKTTLEYKEIAENSYEKTLSISFTNMEYSYLKTVFENESLISTIEVLNEDNDDNILSLKTGYTLESITVTKYSTTVVLKQKTLEKRLEELESKIAELTVNTEKDIVSTTSESNITDTSETVSDNSGTAEDVNTATVSTNSTSTTDETTTL